MNVKKDLEEDTVIIVKIHHLHTQIARLICLQLSMMIKLYTNSLLGKSMMSMDIPLLLKSTSPQEALNQQCSMKNVDGSISLMI